MARNNSVGPQGDLNNMAPCSACKLLRRRCTQECPFSPYFSAHDSTRFSAVHKVFGASNVSKMLMEVPESQRADTADSLVYEAAVRLEDPVHGCTGEIYRMQSQIEALEEELNTVRAVIRRCKNGQTIRRRKNGPNSTNISSSSSQATMLPVPEVSIPALPPSPPPPAPQLPLQAASSSSMYGLEPSSDAE